MTDELTQQHCEPCEGGVKPMTEDQAQAMMAKVPGWDLKGDRSIERTFKFKNFVASMDFVNKVAALAESEGHHPDIAISYNKVALTLSTHAIGGLSTNDFIVAAKINALR